jgi:uncharacterized protein
MLKPSSQPESALNPDYGHGDPFVPRPWLRNRHLQTLATRFLRRGNNLPPPERRVFEVEPGVSVACLCHWQPDRQSALTVLIVHGLEGSCDAPYVIGTAAKAWAAGMNAVRMNIRSCGGTEDLSRSMYNCGLSRDVAALTRALIQEDSLRRVALVGFSMGGNQVLKLAGEWGSAHGFHDGLLECPPEVKAVAAISPAIDLALSAAAMHLTENRLYELHFLLSLRARLRKLVTSNPGKFKAPKWWWKSIEEFDDTITAPNFGFSSAQDYYAQSSASRLVERIALPALVIHAADDPFIRLLPATRAKLAANPHIYFIETAHGGHCGFIGDSTGQDGHGESVSNSKERGNYEARGDGERNGYDGRWAERQVIDFFRKFQNT